MLDSSTKQTRGGLVQYVTPLTAWALAFGAAVGWGAFIMPGTTFLPIAGPVGAVLGIVVGMLVMLVIAVNYHFLMNRHADIGGAFTFVKKSFGYDHGFLCAWFLALTYIAIVWANTTALPLIERSLLGGVFQFGPSYEVAGYSVYLGEVGFAVVIMLVACFLCMRGKPAGLVQVVAAVALIAGIVICFVVIGMNHPVEPAAFEAGPTNGNDVIFGFFSMVALAPWAYVGFESISHSTTEFTFSPKKSFTIMVVALVTAGLAYSLLALMAIAAQPAGYSDWSGYISDLGSNSGIAGIPTFFAAYTAFGDTGLTIIGVAVLCAVITGLIGNMVASSRLLCSMASDKMLPDWFGRLNKKGSPANAIAFIAILSAIIPFFGRTAISWIVDVTTVGAAIAYAYTSACALKQASKEGNTLYKTFGVIGLVISGIILLSFLVPNILAVGTLSAESYLILAAWSVLGFAFFHHIFVRDKDRRLGHSTVVWIVLLGLILFTSLVWMRQSVENAADRMEVTLQENADMLIAEDEEIASGGDASASAVIAASSSQAESFISEQVFAVKRSVMIDSIIQMVLIVASLFFVFRIYLIMQKRESQAEVERALAEESSRAKTSFLSNMSHEIRTPMNAIIGLDNIALKDPDISPRTRERLEKIGASARHLLGLINDILDMSRIESGRMALKDEEFAFRDLVDQVNVIINGQCEEKGLTYECRIIGQTSDYYVGDDMKLRQVLINILGNSVKFTDAPGKVTFTVEELSHFEGLCTLRFSMADTGIGMDKEYIPKIFEAFSQEDETSTNMYGGSGLGMAITKNLVEMMNGRIDVESEKGVGSTFIVTVALKVSSRSVRHEGAHTLPTGLRALAIDDDEVACAHAKLVLNDLGISGQCCMSASEAVALVRARYEEGEPYDLVLTDYLMPEMDGIELTRQIRGFDGGSTVILVLTGYSFDDAVDDAWEAGADGLLSKPLFSDTLMREILSAMDKKGRLGAGDADEIGVAAAASDAGGFDADAESAAEESVQSAMLSIDEVLAGRRILLAEDIEINAGIMIDLLDMEGITAEHAINGEVAVDMFDKSDMDYYDAILMDVRMPVLDGLGATAAIRSLNREDARTVPIIALTANAFDDDVQRSLQAGMDAHLSKPVEPERLYETLAKFIANRRV